MSKDFTGTSIEYNWGFIDGLLWVLNSGNKIDLNEIFSKIEDVRKINDTAMEEEEQYFKQRENYLQEKAI